MTTTMNSTNYRAKITARLHRAWQYNRLLTLTAMLHVIVIPALFIGMVVDPKVITGVNGWIKPLKFAISSAIYGFTFVWFLTFVQGRRRWVQVAANVTGVALLVETSLIIMQVVRGTASHFNVGTAFDAAVFSTMGTFMPFGTNRTPCCASTTPARPRRSKFMIALAIRGAVLFLKRAHNARLRRLPLIPSWSRARLQLGPAAGTF